MYEKACPEFFVWPKNVSSPRNLLPNSVEGVQIHENLTFSLQLQMVRGEFLGDETFFGQTKNSGHAFYVI